MVVIMPVLMIVIVVVMIVVLMIVPGGLGGWRGCTCLSCVG
jgi:hypothetical protein